MKNFLVDNLLKIKTADHSKIQAWIKRYFYAKYFLPPPAAKMRWPAPIRARLPLCEGSPAKQQFGRATEA